MIPIEPTHSSLLPEWGVFESHYISKGVPHRFVVRAEPAIFLFVDEHGARLGALLAMPTGGVPASPLEEIDVKDVRLNGGRYLELSTTHRALYRNFFFFVSDIVTSTFEGAHPNEAFAASVTRWKALLQTPTLMGNERQRGLFGELWMLRRLFPNLGLSALDAWTGPAHQAHDFRVAEREFEVKTTSRSDRVHIINGTHQLEPSVDCQLYILSLQLADGGSGGSTLPELVSELLELMKDSDAHKRRLLNLLADLGFDWSKKDRYPHRWKLRTPASLVPVVDGCPRIVQELVSGLPAAFVPSRIGRINYEVNLDGLGFLDGSKPFLEVLPS
jgi:hypothetical protein